MKYSQKLLTDKCLMCITLVVCALLSAPQRIDAKVDVGVGMRDSHYANINISYLERFTAEYEQSLFSEKFGYQYARVYVGYRYAKDAFSFSLSPFFGRTFNDMFYNFGAFFDADIALFSPLSVYGSVVPFYDSTFGYTTCYRFGVQMAVVEDISIRAAFTSIPEYRLSERRLEGGLRFTSGKLSVTPMLSTWVTGENKFKSVRVNLSFNYRF